VAEYRALERVAAAAPPRTDRREVAAAMVRIKPGDILVVPGLPGGGRVAVLATSERRGGDVRLRGIDVEGKRLNLAPRDFTGPPAPVGRVELPRPFAPNTRGFQRAVASALRTARIHTAPGPDRRGGAEAPEAGGPAALASHPVAGCPDLRPHVRALDRAARLERDVDRLERLVKGRAESLARQFDRVLQILDAWGYVDGWALTDAGGRLCRIYHESDLLVAECVRAGLLDGLDGSQLAGLASVFTYEARGPATGAAPVPRGELGARWRGIEQRAAELNLAEEELALPVTRLPDAGFVDLAMAWASGEGIDRVLEDDELAAGDFVRNIKQLVDLLRQIADVAPVPATARAARAAAESIFRGVVAASSVVSV
jgi:ATP-dependent RNA helicase HelY